MRRQFVLRVSYVYLLVLALLPLWGAAQTAGPGEVSFPTFGVCVVPPEELTQVPEGGMSHVARWAKLDPAGTPVGVVTLEAEPARGRTARDWARDTAGKMSITIVPEASSLGDISAVHLRGNSKVPRLHPEEAYACLSRGYIWVVASFTSAQWSDPAAVEQVRKSVRFIPPVAPLKAMEFYPQPKTILGNISVNVPVVARPLPTQQRSLIQFGIWNYVTDTDEFSIVFDGIDGGLAISDDATVTQWVGLIAQKHGLTKAPAWHRLEVASPRIVTEPFFSKLVPPAPGSAGPKSIVGAVGIAPNRTLVITATMDARSAEDEQQYIGVARRIVESVEAGAAR